MKTNSLKNRTLGIISSIALILSMVAVALPATPVHAAALTGFIHSPATSLAGATTTHTDNFTTSGELPTTGSIKILYPAGFDVAGAELGEVNLAGVVAAADRFTLTVSGQTLIITNNGAAVPAGWITVEVEDIVNTTTSDDDYATVIGTFLGGYIDGPTTSNATFAITPGATFDPIKGPVRTTITVSGPGWTPGELINAVTVDGASAANTLTVNGDGVLSGTITVPATASGVCPIVITGDTSGAQTFATAFTQTTANATFTPVKGPVGTTLTITAGTGWVPSDTISTVTVGTVAAAKSLTVNSNGDLSGTITVPSGLTTGDKTMVITGAISGAQTYIDAFTVTTAAATFAPDAGPAGAVITVTGTGWGLSDTAITVTVGGISATDTLSVNGSGDLTGTITAPSGLSTGLKPIVITGAISGAHTFAGAFTVTTATAVFNPTQGAAGVATLVTVTGSGWVPNDTNLSATVGGVAAAADTLAVDASGNLTGTITVADTVPGGTHNIVITGDISGAQTFANAFSVSVTITLVPGWNLISLPLIPTNSASSNLASRISPAGSVYAFGSYDCGSKNWKYWLLSPGVGNLTTVVDGKSYWVYAYNQCTLSVTGTVCPAAPGPGAVPTIYQYSLCYMPTTNPDPDGWNMLGFKSTQNMKAQDYLAELLKDSTGMEFSNSKYTSLYRYDSATSKWISVGKTDNMTPGAGYFIKMRESGKITPPCD